MSPARSHTLKLSPAWRAVPKRWGHSFHPMCSYLAMFPPTLPRYFIEQFTRPGDVVLDPFSGRGTAPLEACVAGRIGVGVDLNPLAYLLTTAKVDPPTKEEVLSRISELREMYEPPDLNDVPDDIKMLFDEEVTLPQLVYVRNCMASWRTSGSQVDKFVLAALMGVMHGNHRKNGGTSYLSISMPNTFSMAPRYVRNYIKKHGLVKPRVDVFDTLLRKMERLYKDRIPATSGNSYLADARSLSGIDNPHLQNNGVKMIFTSPPYLKVVNYGTFNWIRLWMLGEDIHAIDKRLRLDDEHTVSRYTQFMSQVIAQCEGVLRDDGVACFVIGDVAEPGKSPLNLAERVWSEVSNETSLHLLGIVDDHLPVADKVTRIWGSKQGNATKVDRILILYKGHRPRFRYGRTSERVVSHFTTS